MAHQLKIIKPKTAQLPFLFLLLCPKGPGFIKGPTKNQAAIQYEGLGMGCL